MDHFLFMVPKFQIGALFFTDSWLPLEGSKQKQEFLVIEIIESSIHFHHHDDW